MAELKARVTEMMKSAMKSQDKDTVMFSRNLIAAVRKKEIDDRKDLTDPEFIKICATLIKQRQDSIEQFKKGGRQDLVDKEEAELKFLQQFQPAQLSDGELLKIVESGIAESGAAGPKDMGKVMKVILPKLQGRADGKRVSDLVKEKLGSA